MQHKNNQIEEMVGIERPGEIYFTPTFRVVRRGEGLMAQEMDEVKAAIEQAREHPAMGVTIQKVSPD